MIVISERFMSEYPFRNEEMFSLEPFHFLLPYYKKGRSSFTTTIFFVALYLVLSLKLVTRSNMLDVFVLIETKYICVVINSNVQLSYVSGKRRMETFCSFKRLFWMLSC